MVYMDDVWRKKGVELAKILKNLPEDKKKLLNEAQLKEATDEYNEFINAFNQDRCYICRKSLATFSVKNPCLHWLLKPKGFKKKNFIEIANQFGYFQIVSYLRWVSNKESFAKNINDITDELFRSKLIELTIKYKNLEWSFSCSLSDYLGHQDSKHTNYPHYHFQMCNGVRLAFLYLMCNGVRLVCNGVRLAFLYLRFA
jgi:hypothetical protein